MLDPQSSTAELRVDFIMKTQNYVSVNSQLFRSHNGNRFAKNTVFSALNMYVNVLGHKFRQNLNMFKSSAWITGQT
jgi:hypothetical protein